MKLALSLLVLVTSLWIVSSVVLKTKFKSGMSGGGRSEVELTTEKFFAGCCVNTVYVLVPARVAEKDIISIASKGAEGEVSFRLRVKDILDEEVFPSLIPLSGSSIFEVRFRPKHCQAGDKDLVTDFEVKFVDRDFAHNFAKYSSRIFSEYATKSSRCAKGEVMFPPTGPDTAFRSDDLPSVDEKNKSDKREESTCKSTDVASDVGQSVAPNVVEQDVHRTAAPSIIQSCSTANANNTCSSTTTVTVTSTNTTTVSGNTTTTTSSTSTTSTTTSIGHCTFSHDLAPRTEAPQKLDKKQTIFPWRCLLWLL